MAECLRIAAVLDIPLQLIVSTGPRREASRSWAQHAGFRSSLDSRSMSHLAEYHAGNAAQVGLMATIWRRLVTQPQLSKPSVSVLAFEKESVSHGARQLIEITVLDRRAGFNITLSHAPLSMYDTVTNRVFGNRIIVSGTVRFELATAVFCVKGSVVGLGCWWNANWPIILTARTARFDRKHKCA